MGVKISALPTATQAEAASGLIPVVTDPNGDGNLVTKHITASSIGGGGANVNTSSTPPSNPSNGDLWFDEGNAELYIYNSSINGWIQTNGGGGGSSDEGGSSLAPRAIFESSNATVSGSGANTFLGIGPTSFNIAENHWDSVNNNHTVTFTTPILNACYIIPDFQPSGRISSYNNGPGAHPHYDSAGALTKLRFNGKTSSSANLGLKVRQFVVF